MTSVQPELWVDSPSQAVTFYEAAFAASVLHRVGQGDDIVVQLAVGAGAFWVSGTSTAMGRLSPRAIGGATSRTLLVVDDPDTASYDGQSPTARPSRPPRATSTAGDSDGSSTHSAMNGRSELHSENGRRSDPYAPHLRVPAAARHDQLVHQSVRRTGAGGLGPKSDTAPPFQTGP
jgi:hypothetical protein